VSIFLRKPKSEVTYVRPASGSRGSVVIVEFSDFQCPYCQSVAPTLKKAACQYEGRVSLHIGTFHCETSTPGSLSAEASRCAWNKENLGIS